MNVLATFATRDIADSMKDRLAEKGFDRHEMTVMSNRVSQEPPEDAVLEVGTDLEKGVSGFEEKIGKTVNALFGKSNLMEGTGSEGNKNGGALFMVRVDSQADADKAVELLKLHLAADIEVTETDTNDFKDTQLEEKV